jgi:hypothetical protein
MTNKEAYNTIEEVIVFIKRDIEIKQQIARAKFKDNHCFQMIEKDTRMIEALRYAQAVLNAEQR